MSGSGRKILRTIIVDDEPLAVRLLTSILSQIPNIELLASCDGGRQAIDMAMREQPDLMFLDLQMPVIDGFQVVKSLQSDSMPMIVFATAYDQFALSAFDLHAVDYVLKPFDAQRILLAVDRAVERAASDSPSTRKLPVLDAIDALSDKLRAMEDVVPGPDEGKLVVRADGHVKLIPFDKIDWIDAAGDYMCVHSEGETHIVRITMNELMRRLDSRIFRRIHRSTIVNLRCVVEISPRPKGERLLLLSKGAQLKVSRNYRDAVVELLEPQ